MRKIKEVLRLRFELGLGLRAIARSCSIGLGTAHEYLHRAEAAGVTWPLGEDSDEDRLEAALFGGPPRVRPAVLPMPDFAELHRQRQSHPHVTQQLLWEEYRQANPDGYRYSRFCELYQRWRRKQDVVLRQEHKAGEKLFVDWAGDTIPIYDPRGGPVQQAHLFVAVLGASSYTYAEVTPDEQLASWIGAHVRAFEFFQGTPKLVVPDNTKTGVTKACRYDPDLNPTYQEMAMHYGIGVVPARPYRPRDKAKAESGVLLAERWIIAALRNRKFFSIEELNQAIRERTARGLDKSVIRALTQESAWVGTHENIFVLGPTGVGKSFVACALAQKACRDGYSALYTRAQTLFRDLAMARADGSLRSLLARLSRIDVLVIDDWVMAPLSETERRDFWEICEDRYQVRSTILTSQLPVSRWHEQVGDPTLADGILDRLVHNAHRIEMRGDSMRKNRAKTGA